MLNISSNYSMSSYTNQWNTVQKQASACTKTEITDEMDFSNSVRTTFFQEDTNSDVLYGMTAYFDDASTPDNPIMLVHVYGGSRNEGYRVNLNNVNPSQASALEMFALCSYADKTGQGSGSTFGSFQTLKALSMEASPDDDTNLSADDAFRTLKKNWMGIIDRGLYQLRNIRQEDAVRLFSRGIKLKSFLEKFQH